MKQILVNGLIENDIKSVMLQDNKLLAYMHDHSYSVPSRSSIYLGLVKKVVPQLGSAFVDYSHIKNGLLNIRHIHGVYCKKKKIDFVKDLCRCEDKTEYNPGFDRNNDIKLIKPGMRIIIQVAKEPIDKKGASLTTDINIQGRYVVLTPMQRYCGISSKIKGDDRGKVRNLTKELQEKYGYNFIVRTIGSDISKIEEDLMRLIHIWHEVLKDAKKSKEPVLLYSPESLTYRFISDNANEELSEVLVQGEKTWKSIKSYMETHLPNYLPLLKQNKDDTEDIFAPVESEIKNLYSNKLQLDSGVMIVFSRTETCWTIDINSSKYKSSLGVEETAVAINEIAIRTIVEQIILRNISGVIFIDLIDMREQSNKEKIIAIAKELFENDKNRSYVDYSELCGAILVSRQRTKNSLMDEICEQCCHCNGSGMKLRSEFTLNEIMIYFWRIVNIKEKGEHRYFSNLSQDKALETISLVSTTHKDLINDANSKIKQQELPEKLLQIFSPKSVYIVSNSMIISELLEKRRKEIVAIELKLRITLVPIRMEDIKGFILF